MLRNMSRTRLFFALLAVSSPLAAVAADLPTAEEILRIHRTNEKRLSRLHLQVVHRYEATEASGRAARKLADAHEKFVAFASQMTAANAKLQVGEGKELHGEEAMRMLKPMLASMKREIDLLRRQQKPFQSLQPMELYLDGDDYQIRKPLNSFDSDDKLALWRFSGAPLTAETLLTDYRDVSIFSRSPRSTPAARWWHHSADREAYTTQKHLNDVSLVNLPPFTSPLHPRWDMRHPIDAFFSQPAEKYRVVREEEIDGRSLVVVDVTVPLDEDPRSLLAYRGWLDLKRGALPVRMYHRQNVDKVLEDQFEHGPPDETVTTQEIRELPNGACYPSKTSRETWRNDPDAPELTKAEWEEVRAGKRELALVVHRRHTWECSVVEVMPRFDKGFFVIPFPPGQELYDHDAGKKVGALDENPLVQVGQPAPPLSVALWLDGKQRKLEDFKGRVVVLDFWGLWCSACRASVPKLKAIQERFGNLPVTFISIHTGEKDPQGTSARIREFKKQNNWNFIGAIDTGRMIEDSMTSNAYGVTGFPMLVIVGRDGKVAYVDAELDGPACDEQNPEVLAEWEQKVNKLMKERFESVGETWPISEELDDEQQSAIFARVELAFLTRQIEAALKKGP